MNLRSGQRPADEPKGTFNGPRARLPTVALAAVGALVHAQVLGVGFMSDDFALMNAATSPAYSALRDAFPAGRGTYYRPLILLSLQLEHALGGGAAVHHLVNLAMHVASGLLVLAIARLLRLRPALAYGAALVFLVHPLVSFDVAWISGRTDLFAAAFGLGAIAAALHAALAPSRTTAWLALSIGSLLLALASKEEATCVPIVTAAVLALSRLRGSASVARRIVLAQAALSVAWVAMLVGRFYRSPDDAPPVAFRALLKTLVAVPLRLLVPGADRTMSLFAAAHPGAIVVAGAALVVVSVAVLMRLRRRPEERRRTVWLVVLALAPVVPMMAGGLAPATRLMYFPLATTCLAAAVAVEHVEWSPGRLRIARAFAALALIAMVAGSIERESRWRESTRFTEELCATFKVLRAEAPQRPIVFLTSAKELDGVLLFGSHQTTALGTCLAQGWHDPPLEAIELAPVVLSERASAPVVHVQRRSSGEIELRADDPAMFYFYAPLASNAAIDQPEASMVVTDVRNGLEVRALSVKLAPELLARADLLYFDGQTLRRVPAQTVR